MNVRQISLSRRPITIAAALAGLVSLALGAHAALYKRTPDAAEQAIASDQTAESVLAAMKERGAYAKLAVIDASRRNPYERRFRAFSHGLAPINAPENALILSSATPGKVADDSNGQYSVLMAELLNNLNTPAGV